MERTDKVLTTSHGSMAYTVSGNESGSPVILMHGWGCNRTTLSSIEAVVAPNHLVYNVDFPGFGQSPEPASVWGVEDYALLVEDLIEKEKIDHPILLGHSFGGRVAIFLASHRKDIPKMVLVDAAGIKPRRSVKYYLKVYSYKLTKRLSSLIFGKAKAKEMAEKSLRKRASADYLAATPLMRAILSKVVNEDLTSLLPSIQASTLLVWGTNDTATPIRDAHIMEEKIPDAGLVAFEGCGHYSFLDNPRQFAAVIKSFIG